MEKLEISPLVILNSFIVEMTQDDRMECPVEGGEGVEELCEEDHVPGHGPGPLLCHHDVRKLDKETRSKP